MRKTKEGNNGDARAGKTQAEIKTARARGKVQGGLYLKHMHTSRQMQE
jgi:hypothetical protein